jgi:F-type H+-transporting ATPase subunit epsilon
MDLLNLEIITPQRVMVQEEVDMVEATGDYGEFGVLPGHTQFLTTLEIGEIRFMKNGETTYIATGGGIAEIAENKVIFLLNTAEFPEEIDLEIVQREKERAEEFLRTLAMDTKDYMLQERALLRAIARISVAGRR